MSDATSTTSVDLSAPAFAAHEGGKLEVRATKPLRDADDLSLLYTPGVADVCRAIAMRKTDKFAAHDIDGDGFITQAEMDQAHARMREAKQAGGKSAEGKCGEGKCGAAPAKAGGNDAKAGEGKCGEGKCGGSL